MIPHHELDGPEDAPVLVLGNALGTTTRLWDGYDLPFRTLRFDHRGHGGTAPQPGPYDIKSLALDVLELVDHLNIKHFAYAGVSLGGMLGMWLAAHTDRVTKLALICTTAYFPDKSLWDARIAAVENDGLESIADKVVERWFTPHHTDTRRFRDDLVRVDPGSYVACCEAIRAMDLRPELHRITAPAVVIAAAQDQATPTEFARVIADAVPDSELYVVGDAAHLANVEARHAISVILDGHLGGVDVR